MTGLQLGTIPCGCSKQHHDTRLIAITGGPGAGKTAALEMALRSFCPHVGVLPEAATMIFAGGFPRRGSVVARQAAQRAIFHVQHEFERLVQDDADLAVALCDRGTVDGVAYWPGDADDYFAQLGTSHEEQLARYASVVHLRTPSIEHGYNHDNALRIESAAEARAIDERILAAWEGHPKRLIVDSHEDFVDKARHALAFVRAQIPACCCAQGAAGLA